MDSNIPMSKKPFMDRSLRYEENKRSMAIKRKKFEKMIGNKFWLEGNVEHISTNRKAGINPRLARKICLLFKRIRSSDCKKISVMASMRSMNMFPMNHCFKMPNAGMWSD